MLRIPTFALCALLLTSVTLGLAGCSEDRSNLLPLNTSTEINADIDKVVALNDAGDCFEAYSVLANLKGLVFSLNTDVDQKIRDNLTDGVNLLSLKVHRTCNQTDTSNTPADSTDQSDVTPDGTTGTTGTTDTTTGTTGPTTDESTDTTTNKPKDTGNGGTKPDKPVTKPTPAPTPTPKPDPTPPVTTPPDNPDTGGISPG